VCAWVYVRLSSLLKSSQEKYRDEKRSGCVRQLTPKNFCVIVFIWELCERAERKNKRFWIPDGRIFAWGARFSVTTVTEKYRKYFRQNL
jgi:hypothetical protein